MLTQDKCSYHLSQSYYSIIGDSVVLGWSLRICIFNQLPCEADAEAQGPHTEKPAL